MRALLIRLARWALSQLVDPDPRLVVVRRLVRDAATIMVRKHYVSGERKRNLVLGQLRTLYPDARTRDLAYLIECVLQESTDGGL